GGEAALGLLQAGLAGNPDNIAIGTFAIRNHYAGLLEMILPLAIVAPIPLLRLLPRGSLTGAILFACFSWAAAAVILAGIISSLSRMGFIATVFTLVFLAWIGALRRGAWRRKVWFTIASLVGLLVLVVLLPPGRL